MLVSKSVKDSQLTPAFAKSYGVASSRLYSLRDGHRKRNHRRYSGTRFEEKDRFGETPKPAREARALPRIPLRQRTLQQKIF